MPHFRSFPRFRTLTAIAVMLQMIVVQAMAASAELHEHCHDHDHGQHHECVVTLMLHGGYGAEVPDIVPVEITPEPPPHVPVLAPQASDVEPSHLAGGVLAHAPPRGP